MGEWMENYSEWGGWKGKEEEAGSRIIMTKQKNSLEGFSLEKLLIPLKVEVYVLLNMWGW